MNKALARFLLDAIYIVVFFVVMTSAAYGVGMVVRICEANGLDEPVVWILKGLEIGLAAVDAVGVMIVAVILMRRFVRLVLEADRPRV